MRAPVDAVLLARASSSLDYARSMLTPPLSGGRRFARGRAIAALDALDDAVRALRILATKR